MISRRKFIKLSAAAGVALALHQWRSRIFQASAATSGNIRKFVTKMREVGADIPVAQPDTTNPGWWQPGATHYTIDIGQFEDQLHPDLPNATRLWGYGQGWAANKTDWTKHLGGVIAAKRGEAVQITFRNNLPNQHILPVDTTIMGAEGPVNRQSVHLHGGHIPWISDGGPHYWWTPDGQHGPSFIDVLNPNPAPNEAEYYYPNNQSARFMWYHDHALGTTRLNAYAGVATGYVVYDDYELELADKNGLPGPLDPRTKYIVFQDKVFLPNNIASVDPTWNVAGSRAGDLWYAHEYGVPDGPGLPPPTSAVPEFFGDTILVNGTPYPYLEVEQREYRLRILNACNARFLNPRLYYADNANPTEANLDAPGPGFVQFGTEGGFLQSPVMLNGPEQLRLLMAPAERVDLIVDFRDVKDGSVLILYSDAPAPYPNGDSSVDFYPGNPDTPTSTVGRGPNTRTLLQIRVKARAGAADAPVVLPGTLTPTDPFLVQNNALANSLRGMAIPNPTGVKTRYVTLNESVDSYGRLEQMLGTDVPVSDGIMKEFGREYGAEATEVIEHGTMEVWEILNLSEDTHPMHFHLANGQILSRQPIDMDGYLAGQGGKPTYTGSMVGPDQNEMGWKETIRCRPKESIRVLFKFDLPVTPFQVPESPRTGGHEYVWHCHILEHEEHDMMRPLIITDNRRFLPFIGNK